MTRAAAASTPRTMPSAPTLRRLTAAAAPPPPPPPPKRQPRRFEMNRVREFIAKQLAVGAHAVTTPATMRKKTRMVVVYGFGCDKFSAGLEQRKKNMMLHKNHAQIHAIDVMCNTDEPQSMTYDIWKRLVRGGYLLEPTPFVRKVMAKVCRALVDGEHVILVGHSYGGSVVSRVAMYLNATCRKLVENLRVATFGSIFIPPPTATRGIDVRHYVYANDIARVCHKHFKSCTFIHRLEPRNGRGAIQSHMNYNKLIMQIARTASTHLVS